MFFMLVLLAILGFSALTTPTSKHLLEKQFKCKHQELCHTGLNQDGTVIVEKLKNDVKKYWVMAVTSNPQYVLGRSAMSAASGAFCLFAALILVEAAVRSLFNWIFLVLWKYWWEQFAPALRWLNAVCFTNLQKGLGSFRKELRVERWWILGFLETKEKHLPFGIHRIRSRRIRKVVSDNMFHYAHCSCSLFSARDLLTKLAPGESVFRASDSESRSTNPDLTDYVPAS
ncbi:hypothetical protein ACLOJK_005539 [Asimina triloba]